MPSSDPCRMSINAFSPLRGAAGDIQDSPDHLIEASVRAMICHGLPKPGSQMTEDVCGGHPAAIGRQYEWPWLNLSASGISGKSFIG